MAEELTLEIVTPEKLAFSGTVSEVTVTGTEGEFGVLIGHMPFLSAVAFGELNYTKESKKVYFAAGPGYAEVTESKVTIIVEAAETADAISEDEVKKQKEEAEAQLSKLGKDDETYDKFANALRKAEVRMKVLEKKKGTEKH